MKEDEVDADADADAVCDKLKSGGPGPGLGSMMKLHDTRLRPAKRSVEWWRRCPGGGEVAPFPSCSLFQKQEPPTQQASAGLSVLLDRSMTISRRRWRHREIAGRAFPKKTPEPKAY